jgi:hypothetical protein
MTRSSEDNMSAVAGEVNQMDVDYGKNFKILNPNDQIKGKTRKHISRLDMSVALRFVSFQNCRQSCGTSQQIEVTSSSMQID